MKNILILLFSIIVIIVSTRCSKVYVFTHEQSFDQILRDLEIPKYDSLKLIVEYRLWDIGEFGVTKLYRYYLTKDSIWIGEKYCRYKYTKNPYLPQIQTSASVRKNENIVSWTKKVKKLNDRWAEKFEKLKTIPLFDYESDTLPTIISNGGLTFEKFHNRINITTNDWWKAEILHEDYKDNTELKKTVEILKILKHAI